MFDPRHPFYRPLWRRVAIVAAAAIWAMIEYRNDAPIWALLFAVISAWCAWFFFVVYDGAEQSDEERDQQSPKKDEEI